MTVEEIEALLAAAAAKPSSVSSGGHSVNQHNLRDLIALAEHLTTVEDVAITRPGAGLRFQTITPIYK